MNLTRRGAIALAIAAPAIIRPARAGTILLLGGGKAAPGAGGGGGGTVDNLANWPNVANRPVLSGSTLSWVGPVAGGPSTSTDVTQNVTLTNQTAGLASSADSQVITGLNISGFLSGNAQFGGLVINHNNVTVRRCRIASGTGLGFGAVLSVNGSGTITIEDCIIDGQSTGAAVNNAQNGIQPLSTANLIIRRCTFINLENMVRAGSNMTIIDCWFHLVAGADADMIELDGNSVGNISNNNLIQHNAFDGQDTQAGAFLNSAVNMTNFMGPVTNIAITNNAFIDLGATTHDINDDTSQGGGAVTASTVNNGFYSTNGTHRGQAVLSPDSGNFTMATPSATSGALIGGTGILGGAAGGSVAFDAASSNAAAAPANTISVTHTAAGANRAAFVFAYGWGDPITSATCTYGGAACTAITNVQNTPFSGDNVFAWYIVAPATGAQNVVVTFNSTSTDAGVAVVSMTGAHQTTPVGTPATSNATTGTAPTATVAGTVSGGLVVDGIAMWDPGSMADPTAGADQTRRTIDTFISSVFKLTVAASTQAGSAGGAMSWVKLDGSAQYSMIAVEFKPA